MRRRMLRTSPRTCSRTRSATPARARPASSRSRREDGDVLLEVADDGAGVPEEDVARLFERFFRSDRARTTRGSGLGLAIVKHVVESAGGNVEARGGQGRGLDVRCVLPSA